MEEAPPSPVHSLGGTTALITGGGGGMGRGIATAMARAGADIVLLGRTMSTLQAAAAQVEPLGGRVLCLQADVTDRDAMFKAAAQIASEFGGLDTLVTAAYDSRVGPLASLGPEDARADWSSGFLGALWSMQACYPLLKRRKGSVINLDAATGLKPDTTTFVFYASTKEAIRSLTRTCALEWGRDGIRVNTLIPLATTGSFEQWADRNPEAFTAIVDSIPLGYLGHPADDVGPAAVFLAGPAARYITGTTLMADGGRGYLR
jgi:NAD(P)-dependent dehydrogenase (short-subunit alcohol dehydrogenase family)